MKRLRIPAVLAFTLAGATACDDEDPNCRLYCIPADPPLVDAAPAEAGAVADAPVECPMCSDDQGRCPAGCQPVG